MIALLATLARVLVALVRGAYEDALVLAGVRWAPPTGAPRRRT